MTPNSRLRGLPRRPLVAGLAVALGISVCGADFVSTSHASTAIPSVNTCEDQLRSAIATAASGDVIDLSPVATICSSVTLTAGEIAVGVADLTIVGSTSGRLGISGGNNGRVFNHTFTHGTLRFYNLDLSDGRFTTSDNTAAVGGCVYSAGTIVLKNSSVSLCSVNASYSFGDAWGGGILARDTASLTDSVVSGNSAIASGAHGTVRGAGICTLNFIGHPDPTFTAVRSTVSGNFATSPYRAYGGGVWAPALVTIASSTIEGNSARRGGGVFILGGVLLKTQITNSTISGNVATNSFGGGIVLGSYSVIDNSTISFNHASDNGGGIYAPAGSGNQLILRSTIVAKNSSVLTLQDMNTGITPTGFNDLIGSANAVPAGTLTSDPQLGPLAFHGGTTRTHALNPLSPALNAGDNSTFNLPYDQRDAGFNRVVGGAADIGAYERQISDDEVFFNGFD